MCLPQGPVVSGIVVWATRVTNALSEAGVSSTLLFHRARPDHAPITLDIDPQVHVVMADLEPLGDDEFDVSEIAKVYARVIEGIEEQAILCPNGHHGSYAAAAHLRAIERPDIPVLSCCHNDFGYDYAMHSYYASLLSGVIAPSQKIHANLVARLGQEVPIHPWAHAVPYPSDLPTRTPLEGRHVRIVYTGRMDANQKRIMTLMDLVDRLVARGVECEVRLVGDGPEAAAVDARLARHAHATRLPACPPHDVAQHLDWADVFVLTSRFEAICLAMYEAMARGCIPVVSRVSGVEQVITDGHNGFTFDPAHVDDAAQIIEAIAHGHPRGTASIRKNAWQTIHQHHDLGAYAARLASELQRMVKCGTTRPWPADRPFVMSPHVGDPADQDAVRDRLSSLLDSLSDGRVAVWGAGRHTENLLDVFAATGRSIECVLDDNLARRGTTWKGWPIASPADAASLAITDVVISTAMHEAELYARRSEVAPARVHRLYAA